VYAQIHTYQKNSKKFALCIFQSIELQVDNCRKSTCRSLIAPDNPNEFLNVNGPLQLGGAAVDILNIGQALKWAHIPTTVGFAGCISNFTFNAKMYNLGQPEYSHNADVGCTLALAVGYSFGIDTNFIVAILVCIAILLSKYLILSYKK